MSSLGVGTHTYRHLHKSDFKKPGAHRPMAGAHLFNNDIVYCFILVCVILSICILLIRVYIGVEKNNDDAKRIFYRSINKWDAASDILKTEHQIHQLQGCKRTLRDYE